MQYNCSSSSLADPHTWRRSTLADWLLLIRSQNAAVLPPDAQSLPRYVPESPNHPPNFHGSNRHSCDLPEYIFDQSSLAATTLRNLSAALFPWTALLQPEAPALYVGPNGSGNPFHYHQQVSHKACPLPGAAKVSYPPITHPVQTWNALVAGRKLWMLYPPDAAFYSELHPLEWLRRGSSRGALNPPLKCEQRAGDVLFVPRLWTHGTINFGETVGVATPFSLRDRL